MFNKMCCALNIYDLGFFSQVKPATEDGHNPAPSKPRCCSSPSAMLSWGRKNSAIRSKKPWFLMIPLYEQTWVSRLQTDFLHPRTPAACVSDATPRLSGQANLCAFEEIVAAVRRFVPKDSAVVDARNGRGCQKSVAKSEPWYPWWLNFDPCPNLRFDRVGNVVLRGG